MWDKLIPPLADQVFNILIAISISAGRKNLSNLPIAHTTNKELIGTKNRLSNFKINKPEKLRTWGFFWLIFK